VGCGLTIAVLELLYGSENTLRVCNRVLNRDRLASHRGLESKSHGGRASISSKEGARLPQPSKAFQASTVTSSDLWATFKSALEDMAIQPVLVNGNPPLH